MVSATVGSELTKRDAKQSPARGTARTPLLRDRPAGEPTVIEGTGRFVGDRASGSQQSASDPGADGVTLDLVNVPVQQAANTILADILGVRYTVDPKIEGRVGWSK